MRLKMHSYKENLLTNYFKNCIILLLIINEVVILKKVLIVLLVCILILCCTACNSFTKDESTTIQIDTSRMSQYEFEKLKLGMSVYEVDDIVGGSGQKISESKSNDGSTLYTYRYDGERKGYADLVFKMDMYSMDLYSMEQNDLW